MINNRDASTLIKWFDSFDNASWKVNITGYALNDNVEKEKEFFITKFDELYQLFRSVGFKVDPLNTVGKDTGKVIFCQQIYTCVNQAGGDFSHFLSQLNHTIRQNYKMYGLNNLQQDPLNFTEKEEYSTDNEDKTDDEEEQKQENHVINALDDTDAEDEEKNIETFQSDRDKFKKLIARISQEILETVSGQQLCEWQSDLKDELAPGDQYEIISQQHCEDFLKLFGCLGIDTVNNELNRYWLRRLIFTSNNYQQCLDNLNQTIVDHPDWHGLPNNGAPAQQNEDYVQFDNEGALKQPLFFQLNSDNERDEQESIINNEMKDDEDQSYVTLSDKKRFELLVTDIYNEVVNNNLPTFSGQVLNDSVENDNFNRDWYYQVISEKHFNEFLNLFQKVGLNPVMNEVNGYWLRELIFNSNSIDECLSNLNVNIKSAPLWYGLQNGFKGCVEFDDDGKLQWGQPKFDSVPQVVIEEKVDVVIDDNSSVNSDNITIPLDNEDEEEEQKNDQFNYDILTDFKKFEYLVIDIHYSQPQLIPGEKLIELYPDIQDIEKNRMYKTLNQEQFERFLILFKDLGINPIMNDLNAYLLVALIFNSGDVQQCLSNLNENIVNHTGWYQLTNHNQHILQDKRYVEFNLQDGSLQKKEPKFNPPFHQSEIEEEESLLDSYDEDDESINITKDMVKFYLEPGIDIDFDEEKDLPEDIVTAFNQKAHVCSDADNDLFLRTLLKKKGAQEFSDFLSKHIALQLKSDDCCYDKRIIFNKKDFLREIKRVHLEQSKIIMNDLNGYLNSVFKEIETFYNQSVNQENKVDLNDEVVLYASSKMVIMGGHNMKAPDEDDATIEVQAESDEELVSRKKQIAADRLFAIKLSRNYNTIWKDKEPSNKEIMDLAQESLQQIKKLGSG